MAASSHAGGCAGGGPRTGGAGAVVDAWVVAGPAPLAPAEFAGRLR
ncbi:hypothetical protein [Amycolatopsis sp. lyj-23]